MASLAALAAVALALGLSACSDGSGADGGPRLTVAAATSLTHAFEDYGAGFEAATARFSFAGSDALASQIRRGVRPDVYAAASMELPQRLADEGLVEKPVPFAGNRLVIAVAPGREDIDDIEDLGRDGIKLAIGAASVPIGAYTREVLGRLPKADRAAVLENVRSTEPDVAGIVGKLAQGAADAGFLYVTDVAAASDRVQARELPARLRPRVEYGVAVVKGAREPAAARRFIAGLLDGAGAEALARAGFERPAR